MSISEAPAGLSPLAIRLAEAAHRLIVDLDLPSADLPYAIALRVLADDEIRAGLLALPDHGLVDRLRIRHAPVPVAPGETRLVCAATRKHPESCDDCRLLWGAE